MISISYKNYNDIKIIFFCVTRKLIFDKNPIIRTYKNFCSGPMEAIFIFPISVFISKFERNFNTNFSTTFLVKFETPIQEFVIFQFVVDYVQIDVENASNDASNVIKPTSII